MMPRSFTLGFAVIRRATREAAAGVLDWPERPRELRDTRHRTAATERAIAALRPPTDCGSFIMAKDHRVHKGLMISSPSASPAWGPRADLLSQADSALCASSTAWCRASVQSTFTHYQPPFGQVQLQEHAGIRGVRARPIA